MKKVKIYLENGEDHAIVGKIKYTDKKGRKKVVKDVPVIDNLDGPVLKGDLPKNDFPKNQSVQFDIETSTFGDKSHVAMKLGTSGKKAADHMAVAGELLRRMSVPAKPANPFIEPSPSFADMLRDEFGRRLAQKMEDRIWDDVWKRATCLGNGPIMAAARITPFPPKRTVICNPTSAAKSILDALRENVITSRYVPKGEFIVMNSPGSSLREIPLGRMFIMDDIDAWEPAKREMIDPAKEDYEIISVDLFISHAMCGAAYTQRKDGGVKSEEPLPQPVTQPVTNISSNLYEQVEKPAPKKPKQKAKSIGHFIRNCMTGNYNEPIKKGVWHPALIQGLISGDDIKYLEFHNFVIGDAEFRDGIVVRKISRKPLKKVTVSDMPEKGDSNDLKEMAGTNDEPLDIHERQEAEYAASLKREQEQSEVEKMKTDFIERIGHRKLTREQKRVRDFFEDFNDGRHGAEGQWLFDNLGVFVEGLLKKFCSENPQYKLTIAVDESNTYYQVDLAFRPRPIVGESESEYEARMRKSIDDETV